MNPIAWLLGLFQRDPAHSIAKKTPVDAHPLKVAAEAQGNGGLVEVEFRGTAHGAVPMSAPRIGTHRSVTPQLSFDAAMDELADAHDGAWFCSKLAGVKHRNDDGTSRRKFIRDLTPFEELYLLPEPECRFDPNAIRVLNDVGNQVGYLESRVAGEVSHSLAKGDVWSCYVKFLTEWEDKVVGAVVALHHYNPVHLARPERGFEKYLDALALRYDGDWRYVRLIGLSKNNEDGSNRRELIRALEAGTQLNIRPDIDDKELAQQFRLFNEADQMLGALDKKMSKAVLENVRAGGRWAVVFRDYTEDEKGVRPNIALVRVSPAGAELVKAEEAAASAQQIVVEAGANRAEADPLRK